MPLYLAGVHEHCQITTREHYVLILAMMVAFNLPFSVLEFLVRLITLHIPRSGYTAQLCTSFHRLRKFFDFLTTKSKRIFYCDQCHAKLPHFIAKALRGHASAFPCRCEDARTGYMVLLDVEDEMRFRLAGMCFASVLCKSSVPLRAFIAWRACVRTLLCRPTLLRSACATKGAAR